MRTATLALLIGLMVALAGCYEDSDITLHDPGIYRGKTDPLLALQASPEQQARLAERFRLVQTDR